jgi:hypothetical protein
MKIACKLVLILLFFISCKTTKDLRGKTYKYKSQKRTLEFIFDNDSICRLKNTFHCNDIDESVKRIIITCEYIRVRDTLYLKNNNCKDNSCKYDLVFLIPPQESAQCSFLKKEERKRPFLIGPSYLTEYQKYGLVPNIDIDTLYVVKNKLLFTKHDQKMRLMFVFK